MAEDTREENLSDKPLRQFRPGETLYIKREVRGFSCMLFCRFVEIKRGMVHAEVICPDNQPEYRGRFPEGTPLAVRANACFLWGVRPGPGPKTPKCHWFAGLDTPAA